MNILFVGDIVGKVGRKALKTNLSFIRNKYDIDFTIVNAENISNGRGINQNHYNFLRGLDVDCITLGNHYLDKKEELMMFIDNDDIIPPLNSKEEWIKKANRSKVFELNGIKIRVTSILGTAFMKEEVDSPYLSLSNLIKEDNSDIHIVDYHAEASGEKMAIAYAFSKEISALIGTHTHVQTRDAMIIDNSTAYITDVGMCGARNGILGFEKDSVIERQLLHRGTSMRLLDDAPYVFSAVILNFKEDDLKITNIIPIYILGD